MCTHCNIRHLEKHWKAARALLPLGRHVQEKLADGSWQRTDNVVKNMVESGYSVLKLTEKLMTEPLWHSAPCHHGAKSIEKMHRKLGDVHMKLQLLLEGIEI